MSNACKTCHHSHIGTRCATLVLYWLNGYPHGYTVCSCRRHV